MSVEIEEHEPKASHLRAREEELENAKSELERKLINSVFLLTAWIFSLVIAIISELFVIVHLLDLQLYIYIYILT